jgi:hypothetical protein
MACQWSPGSWPLAGCGKNHVRFRPAGLYSNAPVDKWGRGSEGRAGTWASVRAMSKRGCTQEGGSACVRLRPSDLCG